MLKELVDRLLAVGAESEKVQVLHPPAEPEHVYYLVGPNGSMKYSEAEPPPRRHTAGDLATVAAFAKEFGPAESSVVVWYWRDGVIALLDDAQRRDRVTLPLTCSDQLHTLQTLGASRRWHTQQEFIYLLRVQLANCSVPGSLVEAVRRVKFRQLAAGEREIQHGKASLGKQIESELSGAGIIPDELTLYPPCWTNRWLATPRGVACALDIDPVGEKFLLMPLPGAIEDAIVAAEMELGEALRAHLKDTPNVSIYYGSP